MAKKLSLSDLDFSRAGNTPDWAAQLRQEYENEQNKEREVAAQVDAIVKDYASRGETLSDMDIASLFQSMSRGEEWTPAPKADFSQVEGGSSTAPELPKSFLEQRMDEGKEQLGQIGTFAKNTLGNLQSSAAGAGALAADYGDVIFPYASDESKAAALAISKDLQGRATTNRQEAHTELEQIKQNYPDWMVDTVADITGTPSSAASLIGGPAAVIPGADVFLQEYGQARAADLSPEASLASAAIQGGVETGISAIPSGKLLGKLPVIGAPIKRLEKGLADSLESRLGQALNTATKAAVTATGEGLEEGTTGVVQDAAYRLQGLLGPEKAAEYAAANVQGELGSDSYWESMARQARAGFFMGGGLGGIEASFSGAAKGAEQRAERVDSLDTSINTVRGNELLAQRTDSDLAALKEDTILNQDIGFEQQRIADEEAKQQAFEQAEKESTEQRGLEEEAGFQTLERANTPAGTVVERTGRAGLADVVERVPAEPVRPEAVAEQRAAEQRAAAEQAERVKQGQLAEELRKRREAAAKKKESEDKKKTRAERLAEQKRRDFIADQVLSENPNATEAELTAEYERRLADPTIQPVAATKPEPTVEDRVKKVRDNLERAQKAKVSRMQGERIKAVVRRNPDLSVEEIANNLRQEGIVQPEGAAPVERTPTTDQPATTPRAPATTEVPAPKKTDKTLDDQEIDDLVQGLTGESLGMAGESTDTPSEDRATRDKRFKEKGRQFVKTLASRTNKDSRDAQELLHQGKIVVGLNATDLGREEAGRGAEYDPSTGKMYIYLDGIDPNDAVGSIAAALHETTHALATPEHIEFASGKIRAAAKRGNKLAQDAVRLAEADTTARKGDDTYENEEVMAYFADQVKRNEGKPLGSVGAIVRDIVSAARSGMRTHLGKDLNVSIGEVATALQAGLTDAARTDIKPRAKGATLGMIAGPSATSFKQKQTRGETYTGARDFGERFEIPDNKAELSSLAHSAPFQSGEVIPLGELLSHDALYKEYPQLANVSVVVDATPLGSANGQYDPNTDTISVAPHMLTPSKAEALRKLFLHETQHAIQNIEGFVPGANSGDFVPKSVTRAYENAKEKLNKIVENFDLGRAVQTLNPRAKTVWTQMVNSGLAESRDAQAQMFLEENLQADSSDRMIQRYGNTYAEAAKAVDETSAAKFKAEQKAFQTYLRDYGETEARNTEFRSRMTPEELAAQAPESTMKDAPGGIPVERTLDTTPYAGNGRAVPESRTLGMAAVQSPANKAVRRSAAVTNALPEIFGLQRKGEWTRKVLTGLTSNSKFTGHALLEAFEHAKSSPAGEEARANQSLGKYAKALDRQAAAQGITPEELNSQIMQELDAIDATENTYSVNLAAYKAVVGKYGEAGQHLLTLRNQVDNLTKEILRLRAQSSSKPSADEARAIKAMASNLGRYSHRLYATHQGKAGKKYASAMMSAYMKGKKGKKLSPAQQETFDIMSRAAKVLIDDSLYIPDDAGLAEMGGDELIRLYKTWGEQKATAVSLDQMRDELADKRQAINGDTNRLQDTADDLLREILGLKDVEGAIAEYYRGAKQNRGILQERTRIPVELRAVMGEITDPGTRLLASVAKQAEFVARTKFLLEVQNNARPEDLQPPGSTGTQTVLDNKMTQLKGEGFGPLDGWWVSPNLRALLDDVRETIASFEDAAFMASSQPGKASTKLLTTAIDKWAGVAGFSKRMQIVGNLFLQPLNFAGATMMPLVNGNINPATMLRGFMDAGRIIGYELNPSLGLGKAEDAVKYGVTDSATVGELKGLPYEKIQELTKLMSGKKPSQFFKMAKKAGLTLQHTYAMADVWAKIANFHNEVNVLTRYNKLNNGTLSEDQIKRQAADIVNRTNITYKRAAPFFKSMERGGLTAFGTYFYEVFRSQIGNALQGVGEIVQSRKADTPAAGAYMAARGATRLAGQGAYWTAAGTFSSMLSGILFGDDEDEWDKRSLFPEYMQNQDLFPVGTDENGEPIYFAVSRIDAIGPATDIMRQAMTGGMDFDQAKEELLNLYVKPRIVPQIIMAGNVIINDEGKPKDPLIQQWTPRGYQYMLKAGQVVGLEDKSTKALTGLVESVAMPGTLVATRSTNPTPVAPAPLPRDASDLDKAVNSAVYDLAVTSKIFGATFVKPDPGKSLFFAKMDYDNYQKKARKAMADQFHDHPDITDDDILNNVNEVTQEEQKRWNEVARVYRGMQKSGMTQAAINAALKDSKVSGDLLQQVKSQQFAPTAVSKKSFDQLALNSTRDLKGEEKEEAKKKWDAAWKRLNQVQEGSK